MTINGPFGVTELAVPPASPGRRIRRRSRPGHIAWGLLGLLLAILGCGEDRSGGTLVQPCATQVITGRIVTPDDPQVWTIGLWAVPGRPQYSLFGRSDSTGAFSVTAPLGRYILGISGQNAATFYYAATGPTDAVGRADTLQLTARQSVGPIELQVGSCEVRVRTPAALEGADVQIDLWRRDATWVQSSRGSGTCTGGWLIVGYPAVVAGSYVAGTSVFSEEWRPFPLGSTIETARRFVVEAGRRTDAEFELPAPAVLRGSIDGSWQRLRDLRQTTDAFVTVLRPDSTVAEFARLSDSRSWSITSYDTTPRRLALWIGGITRWIGGPSFQEATVFTPVLGETLTVAEEVESGILLRTAGPNSRIVSDVHVELFDSLGVRLGAAHGGSDGYSSNRFAFANLVPGAYYLRLSHASFDHPSSWSDCWHEGAKDQVHATPVRIHGRGELVVLETHMPPAARILGHLQTSQPQDYEHLLADLWKEGNTTREAGERVMSLPTEPFEFSGMEMGRYLLSVGISAGGSYSRWWYPGTWNSNEAQPIEIHDFGQVEEVTWNLPR